RDADVLHGVMLIDVEIAAGFDPEIEAAMPCDELEHVIKEPDTGPHLVPSLAVQRNRQGDRRLRGLPLDHRAAHRTSSSTPTNRLVCLTMPVVIRPQPAHPRSVDLSRRQNPRAAVSSTNARARSPIRTSTKLASLFQYCSPSRSQAAYSSA